MVLQQYYEYNSGPSISEVTFSIIFCMSVYLLIYQTLNKNVSAMVYPFYLTIYIGTG